MLHFNTIDQPLKKVLEDLSQLPELADFRLVGGTSLSLQLGHRKSDDLDFFTDKSFGLQEVINALVSYAPSIQLINQRPTGLNFILSLADTDEPFRKIDIYNWGVKFIRPQVQEGLIRLASLEDIAAFKLEAICSRKEQKDYVDVAILLRQFSFEQMLGFYEEKYPYSNKRVVLTQITDTQGLERSKEPVMLIDMSIQEAVQEIEQKVLVYGQQLLTQQQEKENKRNQELNELLNKRNQKNKQ
jgi:hypothetical protein